MAVAYRNRRWTAIAKREVPESAFPGGAGRAFFYEKK
jgi:hypothetical protein